MVASQMSKEDIAATGSPKSKQKKQKNNNNIIYE